MEEEKYRGLLGDDGYIDYDGILHLIAENDRMKKKVEELVEILSVLEDRHDIDMSQFDASE